ncbi:MAG TPA: hypothetical protein VF008_24695 [Niastella sp.]
MTINHFQVALICLILSTLLISFPSMAQTKSATEKSAAPRKYQPGEHYRYRLTTDVVHNDVWQSKIIAICELQVVTDSNGIPYDEIHWISKKEITTKDSTDHTAEARQVKPYRVSLHPNGQVDLPKIEIASMTGEITDFNTFMVAISPKLGMTTLKKKGDVYVHKEVVKGDFSNGKDIILGNDCLAVQATLKEVTNKNIMIETSFLPPADTCLSFLTADMTKPVTPDTLNNFQMVRPFASKRYNVMYGNEYFIINGSIQKKDGKLTQATMFNRLSLKIKLYCDEQYAKCQSTMPFNIVRNLQLELLQ